MPPDQGFSASPEDCAETSKVTTASNVDKEAYTLQYGQGLEAPARPKHQARNASALLCFDIVLPSEHVIDLGQIIGARNNGIRAARRSKILLEMSFLT